MAGLQETPLANRVHIGFFGRRNAGKSSVVNAVTGQALSIVSEVKGTTTDPVSKAMELLPVGPVVIIDTPGMDDAGLVGDLRVQKAKQILNKTDVAVLVVDGTVGLSEEDRDLLSLIRNKGIPYLIAWNKSDLYQRENRQNFTGSELEIQVSAKDGTGIHELKEKIATLAKSQREERPIVADLLNEQDLVILVTPIDGSAPKGRMILPQVQVIRDILDGHACPLLVQPEELPMLLSSLKEPPKLVVTDSQAFARVKEMVPEDIFLTSFSILFARYKGILEGAVLGAAHIKKLQNYDKVLICEGCTHHRQCEDIGTVKLPGWLQEFTGKALDFSYTSGGEFPLDLSPYSLIIHCGGCMLPEREVRYRQACADDQEVPFTNYGTAIASMNGILERSLRVFPDLVRKVREI